MPVLQRRVLTEALLNALSSVGKPVGDAEMPRGGTAGWQGEPNQDGTNFTPYVVVTPLTAGTGSGPIADPQGDVVLPYSMSVYGVSREQCEWLGDACRSAVATLRNQDVVQWSGTSDEYQRRIQQVVDAQIGQVQRIDQSDPPVYAQTDIVALWTSR